MGFGSPRIEPKASGAYSVPLAPSTNVPSTPAANPSGPSVSEPQAQPGRVWDGHRFRPLDPNVGNAGTRHLLDGMRPDEQARKIDDFKRFEGDNLRDLPPPTQGESSAQYVRRAFPNASEADQTRLGRMVQAHFRFVTLLQESGFTVTNGTLVMAGGRNPTKADIEREIDQHAPLSLKENKARRALVVELLLSYAKNQGSEQSASGGISLWGGFVATCGNPTGQRLLATCLGDEDGERLTTEADESLVAGQSTAGTALQATYTAAKHDERVAVETKQALATQRQKELAQNDRADQTLKAIGDNLSLALRYAAAVTAVPNKYGPPKPPPPPGRG